MQRRSVLVVLGTRPEAVKLAPVVRALRRRRFTPIVCSTGQHRELVKPVLSMFGITPDVDLRLMRKDQSPHDVAGRALIALRKVIENTSPRCVIVQGDTITTFAAAFAAFLSRVPIAHVEAGLRSHDPHAPFPEEMNRILTTRVADLHFAPTRLAAENLRREGVPRSTIHVVGNTIVDALEFAAAAAKNARRPHGLPPIARGERLIVVTGHRRESFGAPLQNICLALRLLADRGDVRVIYAVHPNPNVAPHVRARLGSHPRITLLPPLDYGPFVRLLRASTLVITDSGGVQEEAPYLGKPVLVTRDVTERREGIDAGGALLVGTDPLRIVCAATKLLDDHRLYARMARARAPYGDGRASDRIGAILARALTNVGIRK